MQCNAMQGRAGQWWKQIMSTERKEAKEDKETLWATYYCGHACTETSMITHHGDAQCRALGDGRTILYAYGSAPHALMPDGVGCRGIQLKIV